MSEDISPKPQEVQFNDALRVIDETKGVQGPFLLAPKELRNAGRFPFLSPLCPWTTGEYQMPDSFHIHVRKERKQSKGSDRDTYNIGFSTWRKIGTEMVNGYKSNVSETFSFDLKLAVGPDGKHFSVTTSRIPRYVGEAYPREVPKETTILDGNVGPTELPPERFTGFLSDCAELLKAWEEYHETGVNEYTPLHNRTPRTQ